MHHTHTHGVALPNSKCNICGVLFHHYKPLEYCPDCHTQEGKYAPNWKGGMEETTCIECGTKFQYYPSSKPGKYCSTCVSNPDVVWGAADHSGLFGDDNPNWSGGAEKTNCDWCGEETVQNPEYNHSFCDTTCMGEWKSVNIRGNKHHNWVEGDIDYGSTWWRKRRQQRERDNHTCQYCGITKSELGREPDVHHKTGVREFKDPNDAHYPQNLVSLCPKHHRKAENGKIDVSDL